MLAGPPRAAVTGITILLLIAVVSFYLHSRPYDGTTSYRLSTTSKNGPGAYAEQTINASNTYTLLAFKPGTPKPPGSPYTRTLVIPRLKNQDISWIASELPGLNTAVYTVDDPHASLTVPKNKGREAMVYLTYILDHYDSLPDTVLFFHAHRHAWHNNFLLGLDSAQTIRRLQDSRVARMGYMNTRCHHDPGCPDWIHMDRPAVDYDMVKKPEERVFTQKIWAELHPGIPPPPALSQPCCAQFAVSGERIRQIPRERVEWYREWLLRTALDDADSGRVMEYLWQYIFTGNAEYCPAIHSCYCDGYGICFGSHVKFVEYMDMVGQKEKAQETLKKLEEGEQSSVVEGMKAQLQTQIAQLDAKMIETENAAFARGKDPKMREVEAERLD